MLSPEKLTFGGYALLIALPAVVLAGLGAASLREDRLATSLEMREEGAQLVDELRVLRETLAPSPLEGEFEESLSYQVSYDSQQQLIAPPPMDHASRMGVSRYLPEMDSNQAQRIVIAVNEATSSSEIDRILSLIDDSNLSATGSGRLRLRVATKLGEINPEDAVSVFRGLGERHFFDSSKFGTPIGVLSLLWSLEHATFDEGLADWIEQVGELLISKPSVVVQEYLAAVERAISERTSDELAARVGPKSGLARAGALDPVKAVEIGAIWAGIIKKWQREQRQRAFFRLAKIELELEGETPKPTARCSFGGDDLLIWIPSDEDVIIARRLERVRDEIARALGVVNVNPDFEAAIRIGGMLEGWSGSQTEVSTGSLPADNFWPTVDVTVSLRDADRYFASVDQRRWRFGLLILLSLLSVSIGLVAIYRAFRRQQLLNEQRSNFVASVSHELRTPTASIALLTEELMAGDCDERAYHQMIFAESQRLSCLVENVLDVSRIERGAKAYEFESCDFVRLVESTVQCFRPTAQRFEISVRVEKGDQEIDCDLDPVAIQRCLHNLLDNAVKFSSRGQSIEVALGASTREAWFEVRDQGKGIDSSAQQVIFQPFRRLGAEMRRESVGVGLGLALAKHVVEGHCGWIDLSSAINEGSTFRIVLPRRHENA